MDRETFLARSETFGFDTDDPWGLDAIRLVCSVPRLYEPLVESWDERTPGTRAALDRMVARGFVAYQPPVIVDTLTGEPKERSTRKVPRYRTTWMGHELVLAAKEDIRVLEERFPRTSSRNMADVLALLDAFDLEAAHGKFGLSTRYANAGDDYQPRLPERTAKWWVNRLVGDKYLRELPQQHADVREVVPGHWRMTRALSKQLTDVLEAFVPHEADAYKVELRLKRGRYLDDINPSRVGISGATDFDHDVECQRILAYLFRSELAARDGTFLVEPRIVLHADSSTHPAQFNRGEDLIFYQPDAEIRERHLGSVRRSVIEYERFQSRRDAWSHIERFLGYLDARALPFEPAVLRFVVDSRRRERTYVELIEAFADYCIDHPERIPANPVTLAVSSVPRLEDAVDPLHDSAWFHVQVPSSGRSDTDCAPVLHSTRDTPYNDYFARGYAA